LLIPGDLREYCDSDSECRPAVGEAYAHAAHVSVISWAGVLLSWCVEKQTAQPGARVLDKKDGRVYSR